MGNLLVAASVLDSIDEIVTNIHGHLLSVLAYFCPGVLISVPQSLDTCRNLINIE